MNWYRDLIDSRMRYKGTKSSIGHGLEKNLDEKFWEDVDLWYKLPSWEIQRFINCTAICDDGGHNISTYGGDTNVSPKK